MTRFYEVDFYARPSAPADAVARYLAAAVARRCLLDRLVFVGVDLYDVTPNAVTHYGDRWRHHLVVACLPAGEREPTSLAALEKILSPMLLEMMRREVTPA